MRPQSHRAAPVALTTVFIFTASALAASPQRPSIGRLARLKMEDQPAPPSTSDSDEMSDLDPDVEVYVRPQPVALTSSQKKDLAFASLVAEYGQDPQISRRMRTDDLRAVGYVLLIAILALMLCRKAIRRQWRTVLEQRAQLKGVDLEISASAPVMRMKE
ncbi:hypothetical protein PSEUBRA_001620 [Kalmanozyma brasiliensis GHG001]|uniref:uncharacterized protein n=1 Tax=Kalmanozyma brasiliensis (strain GHG001) TaxID=1365824 RepID=UPI002867BE50|nr:uncharacterized protein PSEUBRA_001620 [Kalmanozyma brasiliensis GHG001]KAF6766978.1 hypothetical protein PSEUBRA_001620 [Kalmanozyma brasiliensis GHG001]